MYTLEQKQEKWNEIKEDFMKKIPENVAVEMDWGMDNNHYFHIKLATEIGEIKGQCDLKTDRVYALALTPSKTIEGGLVYAYSIYLDENQIKYLFESLERYKPVIDRIIEQQKVLSEISKRCQSAITDLVYYEFERVVEKNRVKKTSEQLKRKFQSILIDAENARIL
jgi:hypothetical protein